ncbi:MAG TPA: L-threonylcarbamoyladenylate synthase [Candidatus Avamphibacillus sp.]|nr:L-threonylcarbamoyladenylate synthase [Candidatus Avamphibacillus sp.]
MNETKRWYIKSDVNDNNQAIREAASLLISGKTVAFPTETVYGLGADATDETAVAKIFQAKGRPGDNPLIAHVAMKSQLKKLVKRYPEYVDKLIEQFTPGPITFVLPSNGTCAKNVTAGLDTIGVRIPNHPVAYQLLKEVDLPVAAPSANISGKPSPTTAEHVWEDLCGKIDGLIDAGPTGVGVESTVIDCTGYFPIILRPGGITKEQLEEVVGEVGMDSALHQQGEKPRAPGMKYRHYSPEVPLVLVEGNAATLQKVIDQKKQEFNRIGLIASSEMASHLVADEMITLGENINDVATHLYDALRKFKKGSVDLIVCETFERKGIGEAVMNRLRKAASDYIRKE